jgi:hypothetical protein
MQTPQDQHCKRKVININSKVYTLKILPFVALLAVIQVVGLQLSNVSFKGRDVLLGNAPLSTNFKGVT